MLAAFFGVMVAVRNSVPSVICGIVSSAGICVVQVATAPVWLLMICTTGFKVIPLRE
jgi:hypothetical protein